MKRRTKILLIFTILGVVTGIFVLVRYGFFIVLWLTTPNKLERSEEEKLLIEHLKSVLLVDNIVVTPEYDIKGYNTYTMYVENVPCTDTLFSEKKAIYIKDKLDSIALKPQFKNYIIWFQYDCYDYKSHKYEYKRNSVGDTLSKNDEVQKMLLSFYTEYIYAIDTISSNFSEIEQKIKQKYLTKKLILKLKNDVRYGELDWDPLINAQDASSEWLKTLKIKKVDDTHYIVHYLDKFTNKLIAINLTIAKENQSYKIDDVAY